MVSTITTAAVICEFNPFHNGHKYLIDHIKSEIANRVICIMSGNFVQRGDISILDKYKKTQYAINHGASAVIELPAVYANSNAEIFAKNGVRLAKSLNCDYLCFGLDKCTLENIRDYINLYESEPFKRALKESISQGKSYPKAVSEAVSKCDPSLQNTINDPNNILAIEYVKACDKYGISPIGIKRKNVSHDSDVPSDNIASASYIRKLIFKNNDDYYKYTPIVINDPAFFEYGEKALLYRLKTMSREDFSKLPEITEGIENRFFENAVTLNSIEDIIRGVKTKRYTLSKIRRIIISAFLGITNDMQKIECPYIRILGMSKNDPVSLKSTDLQTVTNVKKDRLKLDEIQRSILDIDILTGTLYPIFQKDRTVYINDYTKALIH